MWLLNFSCVLSFALLYVRPVMVGGLSTDCDGKIIMLRNEMMRKFDVIMDEMEQILKENAYLKDEISAIKMDTKERKIHARLVPNPIAFHAYASHSLQSIGYHHTIPFDIEMTDSTNSFNTYTSVYTVPESGLYVFSWTITVRYTMCATQLVHNANVIGESYPDSENDPDNDSATEIVIRQVVKDDVIFVRATSGCSTIRSDEIIRSSFSGWKL